MPSLLVVIGLASLACMTLLIAIFGSSALLDRLAIRRLWKQRGIKWQVAYDAVKNGRGVLIVDFAFRPAPGFGQPTIWYSECAPVTDDEAFDLLRRSARLTDCHTRDLKSLLEEFPAEVIVENHMMTLGG